MIHDNFCLPQESSECLPVSFQEKEEKRRKCALQGHRSFQVNCAPVAQLIEHRSVTREVVSSTPVGPTLRVLK